MKARASKQQLINDLSIDSRYKVRKTETISKTFSEDTSLLEVFEWIEQNSPTMSIPNLGGKIVLSGKISIALTHKSRFDRL